MTGEDMTSSDAGIQMLLAQCYSYIPMSSFNSLASSSTGRGSEGEEFYTLNACDSHGGNYGFSVSTFYGPSGLKTFWNWGAIRSINSFIADVEGALERGVINEEMAKVYTAEARFIRAYCYFVMVRNLGGVPIITEVLDQYYDGKGNEQLKPFCVRATEKETWDFVLSELQAAADDLPETSVTEFRANKYAALGIKARAALYAASVSKYWDRQGALDQRYKAVAAKKTYMEKSYASDYYNQCIAACEAIINSGKFSLYGAEPASLDEAIKNLGDMFVTKQNCEYIFGMSQDNGVASSGSAFDVEFSPAQTVTGGSSCGRYSVSGDLVDLFDNYADDFSRVDGTVKTRTDGQEKSYLTNTPVRFTFTLPGGEEPIPYVKYDNVTDPFTIKDARFQAWVLYPDSEFRGQTIKLQGGMVKTDGSTYIWKDANQVIGDVTYYAFGDEASNVSGFYNYDNTMAGNAITTGFGLKKFLDPSSFQLYMKSFWYDVRFSEILLSYCEAVVENNVSSKFDTAKKYLNDIRHRAFFKDNIDLTLDNVLHERRVELAFENDYLYTLHRRREFWNVLTDDPYLGHRHSIFPVLDLTSGSPKYIFVRALHYAEDPQVGGTQPGYSVTPQQYYLSISDYGVNGYEPNPVNE